MILYVLGWLSCRFSVSLTPVQIRTRGKDRQDILTMQEKQQEKSPIKQNILLYLDKKGVSQYEFYKKSGVTRGILQQSNGISEENIARFLAFAKDVSIEWLMTGKGDMLKTKRISVAPPIMDRDYNDTFEDKDTENKSHTQEPDGSKNIAHRAPIGSAEGIPLIPIDAMAGALTSESTILEYECERYVVPVFRGADFLIPVKGSSMYPKYSSGDIVACKRVPMRDLFFQWNKVYVIDTNQGALIKRIKPGSTPDSVMIVSDNEKYDPFELPYSAINAVALVIGVIRLE